MFQPVPQVVKVAVEGQRDGQVEENLFYVHVVETITTAILEEIAGRVATWVGAFMLPDLADNYSHTRIVCTDLTSDPGLQFINVDQAGNAGHIVGDNKPNNCSLAIHRRTPFGGKAAKSRIYWPCLADTQMGTVNTVETSSGNSIVDDCDALRNALIASGLATYTYGFVSRVLNGAKRANGVFFEVLGHSLTDYIVDSQRGRLPNHGK